MIKTPIEIKNKNDAKLHLLKKGIGTPKFPNFQKSVPLPQ